MDHDRLVLLGHAIEGLLDDMASKGVHTEVQSVATNSLCDVNNLLGRTVLEAALNQEVAETIDHKRIGLSDDSLHDLKLLLWCTELQLLLEENGCLLIVAAHDLVNDVAPVAALVTVEQAAIVQWLNGAHVVLPLLGYLLVSRHRPWT